MLIGAAISAVIAPAVAHAEAADAAPGDYLPPEIVVTAAAHGYAHGDGAAAAKAPTPLIDIPQTITMITADQLNDQATRQLNDALRYVPGVTIGTGEGHRDQINLRGQNTTADFFLDGMRDDAQYYRPLYDVERIEVLKGANALLFGRGGGGGVINRVSKTADPRRAVTDFAGTLDSFGAWAVTGDIARPLSGTVAARLNATYEEFANHRDVYDGRFWGVSPTVTAELAPDTRVIAHYSYGDDRRTTDRGIPSLGTAPLAGHDKTFFGDPAFNQSRAQTHTAQLRLEQRLGADLTLSLGGLMGDYDKYYGNVVPAATNGTAVTLNGYASNTDRRNWLGQGYLVWTPTTGGVRHTIVAGFDAGTQDTTADRYEVDFGGGLRTVTIPLQRALAVPAARLGVRSRATAAELTTFSAYLQNQLDFGPVQVLAGVRHDSFELASTNLLTGAGLSRTDRKWSPRAAIIGKPAADVSLYASYATSFLPQSGDQFGALDTVTADLAPEKFVNWETGIKWAPRRDLVLSAALFRLERSNSRATDPANPALTVLTGKSRVQGVELGLVGRIRPNWQANLGYALMDGEYLTDSSAAPAGRVPGQLPRHQLSAWTRYDLTDRFALGGGLLWQSGQYATASNTVRLPGFARVDLAAYYALSEQVSVQLNIENLLDERYYPSAHGNSNIQPGEPLNGSLSVRFAF